MYINYSSVQIQDSVIQPTHCQLIGTHIEYNRTTIECVAIFLIRWITSSTYSTSSIICTLYKVRSP